MATTTANVNVNAEQTTEQRLDAALTALSNTVEALLDFQQKGALEQKYNALAPEIRETADKKFPQLSVAGRYIIRQMVKEANNKLASTKRPAWYLSLKTNAMSYASADKAVSEWGLKGLRDLSEEIDSKEATTLIKKYKNESDQTSESKNIKNLCEVFEVNAASLK